MRLVLVVALLLAVSGCLGWGTGPDDETPMMRPDPPVPPVPDEPPEPPTPSAPPEPSEPPQPDQPPERPRPIVLRWNDTFEAYTGGRVIGSGAAGTDGSVEPRNVSRDLGLPRAVRAVVVEMRCEVLSGVGLDDEPDLFVDEWFGGTDGVRHAETQTAGYCSGIRHDRTDAGAAGEPWALHALEVGAGYWPLVVAGSAQVEFAVTLFLEAPPPEDYSAFEPA